MNIEKQLKIYTLENAIKYEGKANPGAVIGQVINAYPEWKAKMKELQPKLQAVLKEVNAMTVFEQTAMLKDLAPEALEPKEKKVKADLKELHNAFEGKVVLRFAPAPSGGMHLGHTYPASFNIEYARKYHGKLIFRIEDTNADTIEAEAYDQLLEDFTWLNGRAPDQVVVQSERLEVYYRIALQLLEEGHAYVCTCTDEDFKLTITKGLPCPCRELSPKEQLKRWHQMFADAEEGSMVVRIKTDIRHKNPALRDWPAMRINLTEHPKQGKKYRVWPLMNFSVAVDDHENGITHTIRGKDHLDNTRKQMYIYDYLKWTPPEFIHTGRVKIEGVELSKSKLRAKVESGEYTGWDDIRIPSVNAFRKRGYQAEAFIKAAKSYGLTMVDKRVEASDYFKNLDFYNREIVDPKSFRYFFVANPKEIIVKKAPSQEIELHLHPEHKHGGRLLHSTDKFLIDSDDLPHFESGKLYRLMDCLNFVYESGNYTFDSLDVDIYRSKGARIIHWLPSEDDLVDISLCMPDGSIVSGKGEPSLRDIDEGTIVQFERKGFARFIETENGRMTFWWLHK